MMTIHEAYQFLNKKHVQEDDLAKNTNVNKRAMRLTIEEVNAKFNEISDTASTDILECRSLSSRGSSASFRVDDFDQAWNLSESRYIRTCLKVTSNTNIGTWEFRKSINL